MGIDGLCISHSFDTIRGEEKHWKSLYGWMQQRLVPSVGQSYTHMHIQLSEPPVSDLGMLTEWEFGDA